MSLRNCFHLLNDFNIFFSLIFPVKNVSTYLNFPWLSHCKQNSLKCFVMRSIAPRKTIKNGKVIFFVGFFLIRQSFSPFLSVPIFEYLFFFLIFDIWSIFVISIRDSPPSPSWCPPGGWRLPWSSHPRIRVSSYHPAKYSEVKQSSLN